MNSESDWMGDGFAKAIMYQKRYKEAKDVKMEVYLGGDRRFWFDSCNAFTARMT